MRIFFLFIAPLLAISFTDSFAQTTRTTSFDDRPACEESKGVWREFGNGCIDECRSKLDKFSICTQAITNGCDCGKGRCWNGSTCLPLTDYKKKFDAEMAEEQKILDEAKKKRLEARKENEESILNNLASKAAAAAQQVDPTGKTSVTNNLGEFFKDSASNASQAAQNLTASQPTAPTTNQQKFPQAVIKEIKKTPSIDVGDAEIPPFFLQQEEAAKKKYENLQNQQSTLPAQKNESDSKILKSLESLGITELPVIPLPN